MAFGWEEALAIANPIGWGPALFKNFKGKHDSIGPVSRKPRMASDVALLDPLKAPLGGIRTKSQGNLSNALGRVTNQARTSSVASGRPVGQYQGEALGRANTMASRGIDDALGGVLGGSSYKDVLAEQEFQDNMALANEIGAMNSPTLLAQILGGLGGAANTGAKFKGLYDSLGKKPQASPRTSYVDPWSYGGSERYT